MMSEAKCNNHDLGYRAGLPTTKKPTISRLYCTDLLRALEKRVRVVAFRQMADCTILKSCRGELESPPLHKCTKCSVIILPRYCGNQHMVIYTSIMKIRSWTLWEKQRAVWREAYFELQRSFLTVPVQVHSTKSW